MGNGWDYSYNIYIEPRGQDLVLHDGNTRADLYQARPGRQYSSRRSLFREGSFDHNGFFTLVFDDTSTWGLLSLSGAASRTERSRASRTATAIGCSFQYDPQGRLGAVQDTLGRWHQIFYSPAGLHRVAVVDCTGRKVTYLA